MRIQSNIIIFSVYAGIEDSTANEINHSVVKGDLQRKNIDFKELEVTYNGYPEMAFLVDSKHVELVKKLCETYNQECYLFSHNDRATELVYHNGTRHSMGTLRPISAARAAELTDVIFDPSVEQHWAAL